MSAQAESPSPGGADQKLEMSRGTRLSLEVFAVVLARLLWQDPNHPIHVFTTALTLGALYDGTLYMGKGFLRSASKGIKQTLRSGDR